MWRNFTYLTLPYFDVGVGRRNGGGDEGKAGCGVAGTWVPVSIGYLRHKGTNVSSAEPTANKYSPSK
jgi:hypothetical protein